LESTATYTVVLSNSSTFAQQDNPGNEFIDVLPAGLTLVSASATSGTAVRDRRYEYRHLERQHSRQRFSNDHDHGDH